MKSVRTKIIFIFLGVSMLCLIGALGVAAKLSYNDLEASNNKANKQTATLYSTKIEGWLKTEAGVLDSLQSVMESKNRPDRKTIFSYLSKIREKTDSITDIYVAYDNKVLINGSGNELPDDYDCTARDWYKHVKEQNARVYESPYLDTGTGEMVITIAQPFEINGKFAGVVGMDLNIQDLFDTITELVDSTDGSYVFIVDSNDNFILHPNSEFSATEEKAVNMNEVLDGKYKEGIDDFVAIKDYDGVQKYLEGSKVDSNGWTVVLVTPASVYMQQTKQLLGAFGYLIVVVAVIIVVISILVGNSVAKPIVKMSEEIEKTKNYELQQTKEDKTQVRYRKRKDEIGKMVNAVGELRESLVEIVKELKETSRVIDGKSTDVGEIIDVNLKSLDSVVVTINEIAIAIDDEANELQNGSEKLNEFSEQIENVVGDAKKISEVSQNAVRQSMDGISKVDELSRKISETEELQIRTTENVEALADKSKSIDGITKIINDIAEQTANATSDIVQIISEIQNEINTTKTNMEFIRTSTKECVDSMDETKNAFVNINTEINEVGGKIESLDSTLAELNDNKSVIVSNFSGISAATEEISASTTEISNRAEEQSKGMNQIADSMEELIQVIVKLESIVSQFKIED